MSAKATAKITAAKEWPLDRIIPYERNPRTHPQQQIDLLAELIEKYGPDQPIVVDEKGVILKGHGRRLAALKINRKTFPVIQRSGLTEDDKVAMRIADNQVALLSGWDSELIRFEIDRLDHAGYDLKLLGFDNIQLVSFRANIPSNPEKADEAPPLPKKAVTRLGDIWLLGKHRVLCGNSTRAEDVERALADAKPNLMVTDPPYGVEYDPNWRNEADLAAGKSKSYGASAVGRVENDDKADWREAWALFRGNVAYVWHSDRYAGRVLDSLSSVGLEVRSQIIWAKDQAILSRGDYHYRHEPCYYLVRKGKPGNWKGDRKQTTLWEISHPKSETGHGAQKPIECMLRPIKNNSSPGDAVYDPFLGSGTTLIAAEMSARYCIGIELSPEYVDVVVERWQTFSGQEAVREADGLTFAQAREKASKGRAAAKSAEKATSGAGKRKRPAVVS